jgi:hypothetical protein
MNKAVKAIEGCENDCKKELILNDVKYSRQN